MPLGSSHMHIAAILSPVGHCRATPFIHPFLSCNSCTFFSRELYTAPPTPKWPSRDSSFLPSLGHRAGTCTPDFSNQNALFFAPQWLIKGWIYDTAWAEQGSLPQNFPSGVSGLGFLFLQDCRTWRTWGIWSPSCLHRGEMLNEDWSRKETSQPERGRERQGPVNIAESLDPALLAVQAAGELNYSDFFFFFFFFLFLLKLDWVESVPSIQIGAD